MYRDTDKVLVVDLDRTLLRSDMLFESFWSACGQNNLAPIMFLQAMAKGRANLKHYLAKAASVDVTTLPYNEKVIDYVANWRKHGGRTALITATDHHLAEAIADHLGLFDEVHGSDGEMNMKGETKGRFLENRFGPHEFIYMGDAFADLPVWKRSAKAIVVDPSPRLTAAVNGVSDDVENLSTKADSIAPYVKALRPHQWLKNTLVFLPVLAAHELTGRAVLLSLMAFVSFSLIASSVYVLNDLLDLSADRSHPRKRRRPFAAGAIPIAHGTWMATGLIVAGLALAVFINWRFLSILLGYFVLTSAYSLHLKKLIVVDICVLAGLYTIRVFAGGAAASVPLSEWLLAFSIFFFLSLAAVKRQTELVDSASRDKLSASGRGYQVDDMPIVSMFAIGAGYVSVLVLALYVNSPAVMSLYAHPKALWGVCAILLYWISRAVMLAHRGQMHDDPVIYAAKDRVSQFCLMLILACVALAL